MGVTWESSIGFPVTREIPLHNSKSRIKFHVLAAVMLVFSWNGASAQSSGLGLGVILGEPSGISIKNWIGGSTAIQGALAWSIRHDNVYVHADYLLHNYNLVQVAVGRLPIYYGIGARFYAADDPGLGVRVPVGLNYQFGDLPLDAFAELVPVLDVLPETEFDLSGAIGLRYFF